MSQYPHNMPNLDALHNDIENQEELSSRRPRLGVGTHTVIIDQYTAQPSKKAMGTILGLDVIVEASTTHQPGERRAWPFFPQAAGWQGTYEKQRVKDFYAAVDASLGLAQRPASETGAALASGQLRGLRVQVTVEQAYKDDGSVRLDKKNRPITNATFSPAAKQTMEQVQAIAAAMPPLAAPRAAAPQQQYAPPQYQQAPAQQYQQAPAPAYPPPAPQYAQPAPTPAYAPPQAQPAPAGMPPGAPGFLQGLRDRNGGQ